MIWFDNVENLGMQLFRLPSQPFSLPSWIFPTHPDSKGNVEASCCCSTLRGWNLRNLSSHIFRTGFRRMVVKLFSYGIYRHNKHQVLTGKKTSMDCLRNNISPPFLSSRSIICQSLSGWTNSPSWSTCNSQPLPHVFPGCCKVIIFLFPDRFSCAQSWFAPLVLHFISHFVVKKLGQSQSQEFKITFPSRIPGDRDSQYDSTLLLTSLWSREPFYSVCLVQFILNCLIFI